MNMELAPKDGTRILILAHRNRFDFRTRSWFREGTSIRECFWHVDRYTGEANWTLWMGSSMIRSSEYIEAIAWWPITDEMREIGEAAERLQNL